MITGINNEDRLVQKTIADYLEQKLGWENVYAWNDETFGPNGTLGRKNEREVVLFRDLEAAIMRLNPGLPAVACNDAINKLTKTDFSRSLIQHNKQFYQYIRNGVTVDWRDEKGVKKHAQARVIDFSNGTTNGTPNNRFVAVRELKIQGLRVPHYNRRADLVCYVNGLPLVFIELKAVYRNQLQPVLGIDLLVPQVVTSQKNNSSGRLMASSFSKVHRRSYRNVHQHRKTSGQVI